MAFTVVHGSPQKIWAPVINTDTLYVGQLVKSTNEGVQPLQTALNGGDSANKTTVDLLGIAGSCGGQAVYGVVVGTNAKTPAFNPTLGAEQITYAEPPSATTETYVGVEGPWAKGDLMAMVEIAVIDPSTVLRGEIFHSATARTAPTVATVTASCSGLAADCGSFGVTTVAQMSTLYFRSGSNAGSYRVLDSTAATGPTWDIILTSSTGANGQLNDTVVATNLRPQGNCRMQVSTEALWIQGNAAVTADYFEVQVLRLDLSVAGSEYCEFRFVPNNFQGIKHST
jgi:hypothetical protein